MKLQNSFGRLLLREWKLDKDCLVVEVIYENLAKKFISCLNMVRLSQYVFARETVAVFCFFI